MTQTTNKHTHNQRHTIDISTNDATGSIFTYKSPTKKKLISAYGVLLSDIQMAHISLTFSFLSKCCSRCYRRDTDDNKIDAKHLKRKKHLYGNLPHPLNIPSTSTLRNHDLGQTEHGPVNAERRPTDGLTDELMGLTGHE